MNYSMCNECQRLVPSRNEQRDGKMYLVKECPDCGPSETLISSDAQRYLNKRSLDNGMDIQTCRLNCLQCSHKQPPTLVFVDLTNRCNMNCPICINNTPSMGFLFEPPLDYFRRIFEHFAQFDPKPAVQLFGGEPTVRKDLIDIVKLAKKNGLRPRIVTNGLKFADEDYCREILKDKPTILLAYDGENPELYRITRDMPEALELKHKAIDNIRNVGNAKVVFMTMIAMGMNDQEIVDMVRYAHECRDVVRAIYLMPLAHTWKDGELELEDVPRITTEDLENVVDRAYPGDKVEFLPAGILGQLPTVRRCLRVKPVPFLGAHPNCESAFLMLSDGKEYIPVSRVLTTSMTEAVRDLLKTEGRLTERVARFQSGAMGKVFRKIGAFDFMLFAMGVFSMLGVLRRHTRMGSFIKGRGLGKFWHALRIPIDYARRRRSKQIREEHTNVAGILQIIVLPFEDRYNIETDRLERCPAGFGYIDAEDDKVKYCPVCSWSLHKTEAMRRIAERYGKADALKPKSEQQVEEPTPAE